MEHESLFPPTGQEFTEAGAGEGTGRVRKKLLLVTEARARSQGSTEITFEEGDVWVGARMRYQQCLSKNALSTSTVV